jgi:Gas vesicle protein K
MPDPTSKLLWAAPELPRPIRRVEPRTRVELDPAEIERGLVQLVLTLVELLRQLMERQALRRVEGGTLTPSQEEQLGEGLLRLATKMAELKEHFGLTDDDLNIHLGPLGDLM